MLIAFAGIVFIALYLYAGHMTWKDMMSTSDDDCRLSREYADGTMPVWVYHFFLVIWAPVLLWFVACEMAAPSTYP